MTTQRDVRIALAESRAARVRLFDTLDTIKARLSPSALAQDAVDGLKDGTVRLAHAGVGAARERPQIVAMASALLGLIFARRLIARLFRRRKTESAPVSPQEHATPAMSES
jgi:hypothetical protein